MISIDEFPTIGVALKEAARRWPDNSFLAVPANPSRAYEPEGLEVSYRQVEQAVEELVRIYADAGYGSGNRVGLLLENRLEHVYHKLAMNRLGVACVPLNPDQRPREIAYVIDHTKLDLVVVIDGLAPLLHAALSEARHRPAVVRLGDVQTLPAPIHCAGANVPAPESISSILYTSGTTGLPKGCMLSHRYELAAGAWYANRGGMIALEEGGERLYNPLPLFHVNSSVLSLFCVMLKGNCQIQTDRFQTSRWFTEVHDTRATVVHYLGVMVPILLNQLSHPLERQHRVKFGLGAGIDPQRHAEYEERFGYPLIEVWGMTEWVRLIIDADDPRPVGTRSFGRAQAGMEVRLVDDVGAAVSQGQPGELLVRNSANNPRGDCFSGYLNDLSSTEEAWRDGWLHTGDIVTCDSAGILHFVERRKNIIRRSGENIAAAEVEAVLQAEPGVAQAAVLSVPDEVREEEVLACIVLKDASKLPLSADDEVVQALLRYCNEKLSYYKVPGWLCFLSSIPVTGTQKVLKHHLFSKGADPRKQVGMIDVRHYKKRRAQGS